MIARYAVAVVVALVGVIFIGQGLGFIGGSGMTGQPFWALVGLILLIVAIGVVLTARRSAAR